MSSGLAITVYLIAAVIAGIVGGGLAHSKRRDTGFWTVACFLVPPLLVILFLLPKRRFAPVRRRPPDDSFAADNLDHL